jgi:hypothetical protein
LPFQNIAAEEPYKRDIFSAVHLMYFSDAVLGGNLTLDEAFLSRGLSAPLFDDEDEELTKAQMAAMLHALKAERNDLDAKCALLKAYYQGLGKDCEVQQVQSHCASQRDNINAQIGVLHKARGDRRRFGTKLWHSLKRTGRGFWHRIGPGGRRFLRDMGPEILQVAATGGFGGVKTLIKNQLKSLPRQQAKKFFLKGVERLVIGQIEIAKAAGLDICDPKKNEETADKPTQTKIDESNVLHDGTTWQCEEKNGPLEDIRSNQGVDMKVLISELDFTIQYVNTDQELHIKFKANHAEERGVWQEDGSIGEWHVTSALYEAEAKNIALDENGIFKIHLTGNIHQTDGLVNYEGDKPFEANMYGLIPPEPDFPRAFVCVPWANEIPTGLETLTGENFEERCGYFYLYTCNKISN